MKCDCGVGDYVTDAASGDVVCRQCGVVVEAHIFDERLEFYSEDAGPRAGPQECWLLPPRPIVLDRVPHRRRALSDVDAHSSVRQLFAVVDGQGHRFSGDVRETAKMLCRDFAATRTVKEDSRPLFAAAALYLATKMHGNGVGRSKKEIASDFAQLGVTENALTVTSKLFKDVLHGAPYAADLMKGLEASDLIFRSVDRLDVDHATRQQLKTLALNIMEQVPLTRVEGKTPSSVRSGVVSCAVKKMGLKLTKKHMAKSCMVSGATLAKMTKVVADAIACA